MACEVYIENESGQSISVSYDYAKNVLQQDVLNKSDNVQQVQTFDSIFKSLNGEFEISARNINENNEWIRLDDGTGVIERYKHIPTGEIIKGRVSDRQSMLARRNLTQTEVMKMEQSKTSKIAREVGTQGHAYLQSQLASSNIENVESVYTAEQVDAKYFKDADKKKMQDLAQDILNTVSKTQKYIDPEANAKIYTEQVIYDAQKDTGGSIDLAVVYSDGSVALFDWKFVSNARWDNSKRKYKYDYISSIKEKSYDAQISEYKRILKERFGVDKFRQTRIIPISRIQENPKGEGQKYEVKQISTYLSEADSTRAELEGLKPIPVASEEYDGNKGISDFIKKMQYERRRVLKDIETSFYDEALMKKETQLRKIINSILIDESPIGLIETINSIAYDLNRVVNEELGIRNIDTLNSKEVLQMKRIIDVIKNNAASDVFDMVEDSDAETKQRFDAALGKIERLSTQLRAKNIELLSELAEEKGIVGNLEEINDDIDKVFDKWFGEFSSIENPVFQLFRKSYTDKKYDIKMNVDNMQEKIRNLTDGMTQSDYDALIEDNGKDLVMKRKYAKEYYDQRLEAQNNGNIKWLTENVKFDKKRFDKAFAEKVETFSKLYNDDRAKEELDKWRSRYDLSLNQDGTPKYEKAFLKKRIGFAKEPGEEWLSEDYKNFTDKQKKFYDFWIETMREYSNGLRRHGIDLNSTFIPNINKTLLEHGMNGMIRGIGYNISQSFQARVHDEELGYTDEDGELEGKVPLLYSPSWRLNDEYEKHINLKSKDLGRSMFLFATSVETYLGMQEIEDEVLAMRELLTDQKIVDPTTGAINQKTTSTTELFDIFVKEKIYGKTTQDKDRKIVPKDSTVGKFLKLNRDISMNKTASTLLQYSGLNTFAYNPLSASVSALSTFVNRRILAAEGRYIKKGDFERVSTLAMSNNPKYNAVIKMLDLNQTDLQKANNLSVSKLRQEYLLKDPYVLLSRTDRMANNNMAVSMMRNYGIDKNGKIVRLAKLEEGSESLWEMLEFDMEKGLLIKSGDKMVSIFSEESPLNIKSFSDFRLKAEKVNAFTTGMMSDQDSMAYRNFLMGKFLGQYRSWLPVMVKSRLGKLRYDPTLEEWEVGRYRVLAGELTRSVTGGLQNLLSITGEMVTLGLYKHKMDEKVLEKYYQKYLEKFPGKFQDAKSREEFERDFRELRTGKLRSVVRELRMTLGFLALTLTLSRLRDDEDDEEKKKQLEFTAYLANRMLRDLTFIWNPNEFQDVFNSVVPIAGTATRLFNAITNGGTELIEAITDEHKKNDKTPLGHFTISLTPMGPLYRMFNKYLKVED